MERLLRVLLAFVLLAAGILHLCAPTLFDPAIPFSHKITINVVVGILEMALALGLLLRPTRDSAAKLTALWFLLLVPVHLYVSINAIPMFGISHPTLLWGRTHFQGVLFFWALSLQDKGWIIAQRWQHVLFLHYEVAPELLQKKVPFPLDLFDGKAVVSIVPFVMSRIRFPFLPPLPGLSRLVELNLRTYVRVGGVPAVYFFTLDSNHLPGVLVARTFFALPYRWKSMRLTVSDRYHFSGAGLELVARIHREEPVSDFERWATERYALGTLRGKTPLIGVVEHAPWRLAPATLETFSDEFSTLLGDELKLQRFLGASYARKIEVRFRPFAKVPG